MKFSVLARYLRGSLTEQIKCKMRQQNRKDLIILLSVTHCRVFCDVCTKREVKRVLAITLTLKYLKINLTKGGEKPRGLQHIPTNSTLIAIEAAVILVNLYLSTACKKRNKMSIFQC